MKHLMFAWLALTLSAAPARAWDTSPSSSSHAAAHAKASAKAHASSAAAAQGGAATASPSVTAAPSVITQAETIAPPGLSALTGTSCMGSSSASVGGMTIGLGFGTTWHDPQCELRQNIELMLRIDPGVARQMALKLDGVREARQELGLDPASVTHLQDPWRDYDPYHYRD